MEEVTPNEEFVTRSVSIREDSTTRLLINTLEKSGDRIFTFLALKTIVYTV